MLSFLLKEGLPITYDFVSILTLNHAHEGIRRHQDRTSTASARGRAARLWPLYRGIQATCAVSHPQVKEDMPGSHGSFPEAL